VLLERLSQLEASPEQIVIGMEATSRYHENLYHELEQRGYQLRLLHPGQTHHFHQQQGLRAKTDQLDAMTIARALLSGEERVGYIPSEQISTYRELVRLHTQSLVRKLPAIRTRSTPWWWCSYPEFTQVFADPCLPSALAVLKAYPHAQAVAKAGVEAVYQVLRGVPSAHFGRPTAKKLVLAAQSSSTSSRVLSGRASSLCILCDQLEQLISTDPRTKGLRQIPELGPKSVAVLRAELGEVDRFARTDQAVAYADMDVEIKESGKSEGESQALQAGKWFAASDPLSGRLAQYSARRLRLRGLLSSSGRARAQENVRHHGRHAQDGGGRDPSDENGRGLQSQQSLGGDDQLRAPLAGHPHPDRA